MNTADLIRDFARRYYTDSKSSFHKTFSAELLTKQIPESISSLCNIDRNIYRIYGSVGNDNWAEIPWVAILDKDITTSTQNGYYVVILFDKAIEAISICLSLGWTQFENEFGVKEGRRNIKALCAHYAQILSRIDSEFIAGSIDLGATHNLGKGYEEGAILHKRFHINTVNENELKVTITKLLDYYQHLKSQVGDSILNIHVDIEKYEHDIQDFRKEIALATFKPINEQTIANLMEKVKDKPPLIRERLIKQIVRNKKFALYTKQKANFICELCGRKPFKKSSGEPYAEADHIKPLGTQGPDNPSNLRCLCAQCHAIITYGSEEEKNKLLLS